MLLQHGVTMNAPISVMMALPDVQIGATLVTIDATVLWLLATALLVAGAVLVASTWHSWRRPQLRSRHPSARRLSVRSA